jgi:hypothetical protein
MPMTDTLQTKSVQTWSTPKILSHGAVSNRNTGFIWPAAVVIFGLVSTFAWITFLEWTVFLVF